MSPRLLVLWSLLLVAACDQGNRASPPPGRPPCTKMGQNCEFSPGKLGTCVIKEPCPSTEASCLVCQSQH
ncbi:MAG: hypothetical protein MUF64_11215 [Polyangiaceae bacterium]|nr:hypothetical protein [Polyangiaceae bacterium]